MYELEQVGEKTYYINCPAKMGIYKINNTDICLIDSGNDKNAAKKILKILNANGWNLRMIINTHSHADHIGGNSFLQQQTNCHIYILDVEMNFTHFPFMEPTLLYGGYPCKALRNKFLNADPSNAQKLTQEILPKGIEMIRLDGHSIGMAGFKTDDEILFLADSLISDTILQKYHIAFLYDVEKYIESLETLKVLQGKLFIPAHAEPTDNIKPLIESNTAKLIEIQDLLKNLCTKSLSFDDILQAVFNYYSLTMDFNQYVLAGSTIRSHLAYLLDQNILKTAFTNNKLTWQLND